MKKTLIFFSLVIVVVLCIRLGGCVKPTALIVGDSQAVDAEIYIDGQKVGVMEKRVYDEPISKNPVVIEREKKKQQSLGIKPGDIFSWAQIKIPYGKHEIMFVNKEGKRLKKKFETESENYMNVDFEKMAIQGP